MGLALHQNLIKKLQDTTNNIGNPKEKEYSIIRPRIVNFEPSLQLKDLRVNYYGKLVSVRGTVIKSGNIKIICSYMTFLCSSCSSLQTVQQTDGNYTLPSKCITTKCRAQSNFIPQHSSVHTKTISYQSIRIQELIGTEQAENGRVPRTLDCVLMEDLVKTCIPGDDITITGIIKVENPEQNGKSKQQSLFQLYLHAISVVNNKNQSQGSYGASERITFNIKDYYAIQQIHSEPKLFRFLVQSLCPNIYGHEIVKAGLLLALFGGTKCDNRRAESHILMVGDPGLGKSQMLQACTNVAPRGVYVCGNTSTSSGLTVTMTREVGGEYALEAGALMLADQGCCCIDEFDKMPSQHACLLEAMEQQSISIAKAGIVCTLPTRTTILAAANPAGGHYDKSKTIAENLKISSPMLSRFDLIFILLDQPNEELDLLLSRHVLALHAGIKIEQTFYNADASTSEGHTLRDKLRMEPGETLDLLPHGLFRKYIAYAQKYVNPQLSDKAKEVIKQFYLTLRKQFQSGDCTPVTTRQLNSLIRLSQARAKSELREIVTEKDALEVVEIMRHSLVDLFTDEYGILDNTRSQNGTGMSKKNQVSKLLRQLQRKSEVEKKSIFSKKEIQTISEQVGLAKENFYKVLQSLNIQGYLLNKGHNNYQLVSADI
ncbi:DNA helicase MCM8-like isoform X2 [Aethina tumida]|nr:DNA helicase MCM8-like isoform X2 [Aethina tumida]